MKAFNALKLCTLTLTLGLLSGCASSVFISYPSHLQDTRSALRNDQPATALKAVQKQVGGQSVQLDQAELGRVAQITGDTSLSITAYQKAIDQVQAQSLQAKVQVSRGLETTGSLLVNDNTIPYRLQGYEAVILDAYQALNYLQQNNLSAALVMIRQAGEQQTWENAQQQKALAKAQDKANAEGWQFSPTDHAQAFSATLQAAANIKSQFENGFVYYLSALAYQAAGHLNDAVVSTKNALAVAPANPYLRQQLLSLLLLRDGPNTPQLLSYQQNFALPTPTLPANAGEIAVIFEQGLIPPLQSITLPLPLFGINQIQTYSFPVMDPTVFQPTPLAITLGSQPSANTELLTSLRGLMSRALLDNYPMIFVRETLRLIAKTTATYQAQQQGGNLLGLAVNVYSILTSQPDLRSWLTLPDNIQIAQWYVAPGTYPLVLSNGSHQSTVSVTIAPNQIVLVSVIEIGQLFRVTVSPLN